MNRNSKRAAIVAATAVVAIGGGAAAWAAWISTGTAQTTGTAGTSSDVQVQDLTLTGNVRPEHPANLSFKLYNDNDYTVDVTQFEVTSVDVSGAPGCNSFDEAFQVDYNTQPTIAAIPSKTTTGTYNWNGAIKTTADPKNECKGASLTVHVKATAQSH